ncbi:iron ABC transporter permease [Paenibacillus sp. PAMC21692]|uniref:FecCD family ABC transporter permease n=1 Tax=Paenibacillus sp. PAMC21692 TaxID=2762320 RepID=UPI00164D794B|nr:iron ABC transporter permease [Paenibacillus sp. PAMC21692]QNK56751.1 iron ABC transporter permease [Paenibacillus sp. PAMC21692]
MRHNNVLPAVILVMAPAAALLLIILSILYGSKNITALTVWQAVAHFDPDNVDHQIIRHARLPRAVGALFIGAALAVSGALMQGMTRNYLASPSIMGVSDGSVLLVTFAMIFLPYSGSTGLIIVSVIGSALGAGLVFGLAWLIPGGLSPVKLAILGTIVGTFLSGVSAAAASYFQYSQSVSFWYNARLHQIDPELLMIVIPFVAAGLLLALCLAKSVTVLSLGEDIASGLGQRTALTRGLVILAVVVLTGAAVALAGKIAFIGLIVPHLARFLVGVDYRRIIPLSAAMGALFLGLCDLISRFLNAPFETPIGVVTALFGVPFFLYLIKTRGGGKHA